MSLVGWNTKTREKRSLMNKTIITDCILYNIKQIYEGNEFYNNNCVNPLMVWLCKNENLSEIEFWNKENS